jgi:hypothetical protein
MDWNRIKFLWTKERPWWVVVVVVRSYSGVHKWQKRACAWSVLLLHIMGLLEVVFPLRNVPLFFLKLTCPFSCSCNPPSIFYCHFVFLWRSFVGSSVHVAASSHQPTSFPTRHHAWLFAKKCKGLSERQVDDPDTAAVQWSWEMVWRWGFVLLARKGSVVAKRGITTAGWRSPLLSWIMRTHLSSASSS